MREVISHYKILEKLGAGGMGVVYRAEDLKLKRFVALKFLPTELTHDAEAKERFIQEAQAASALDHPNICTIHEIDETEDGQLFIVMAYYAGETLQQRVSRGQLSVDNTIDLAIQMTQGLAKAHEHGIVHRDIKPANVIITKNGVAKIVDFGLAKLSSQPRLTKTGSTVGTMAYMSPEQARGEAVDHRTDIWALGVVIYEMLTGQLPFWGEYEHAIMYAILNEEPKPITKLLISLPKELNWIIEKALAKKLNDRYQHLDEMLADLKFGSRNPASQVIRNIKKRVPKRKQRFPKIGIAVFLILLFAVGLMIVIAYTGFFSHRSSDSRLLPMKTVHLTSFQGDEISPALSPDGNLIAFSWNGPNRDNFDIYVRQVDAGTPVRVTTHPADDLNPTWSPDGRYLAFNRVASTNREVYIIPALGGSERKLADAAPNVPSSMSWSMDGMAIFITDRDTAQSPFSIFKIMVQTGKKREFIGGVPPGYGGDHSPRVSPSGQTLAFIRSKSFRLDDVYLAPTSGGEPKRVTSLDLGIAGLSWTADGREIIFSSDRDGSLSL